MFYILQLQDAQIPRFFLLYFLKLSGVFSFWSNVGNTDKDIHQAPKSYQKTLKKYMKAKHDVKFLNKCKQEKVFPKFVLWKNIKSRSLLEQNYLFTRNLNETINKRQKELNLLKIEPDYSKQKLLASTTWIKGQIILFSINRMQCKHCHYIKGKQKKKLDAIIVNKVIRDGIKTVLSTNLTDMELTEIEVSVLKVGLKHRLLTRPKESEMIVIAEDIWDQTLRNDDLKEDHISKYRLQTALKVFTYNYLNIPQYILQRIWF